MPEKSKAAMTPSRRVRYCRRGATSPVATRASAAPRTSHMSRVDGRGEEAGGAVGESGGAEIVQQVEGRRMEGGGAGFAAQGRRALEHRDRNAAPHECRRRDQTDG